MMAHLEVLSSFGRGPGLKLWPVTEVGWFPPRRYPFRMSAHETQVSCGHHLTCGKGGGQEDEIAPCALSAALPRRRGCKRLLLHLITRSLEVSLERSTQWPALRV